MKVSDIIGSVLLLLFCFAAYYEATNFSLGTDAFPKAVLIVIMILAAVQLALAMKPKATIPAAVPSETMNTRRMVFMVILLFVYILAIQVIGYFFATPLFLMASMYMLGRRDAKTIIIVTFMVCLVIYLVFRLFLYVPVPMGPLFYR